MSRGAEERCDSKMWMGFGDGVSLRSEIAWSGSRLAGFGAKSKMVSVSRPVNLIPLAGFRIGVAGRETMLGEEWKPIWAFCDEAPGLNGFD